MKDARGHGSNARPIPGHPYHSKTNAELRYIAKDAAEAGRNAQGMGDQRGVSKYADQVADAATVMGYRARGGKSDAPADQLHSGTPKSDPTPIHDAHEDRHNEDIRLGSKYGFDRPTKIGSGI
jgi:hypothetical protein